MTTRDMTKANMTATQTLSAYARGPKTSASPWTQGPGAVLNTMAAAMRRVKTSIILGGLGLNYIHRTTGQKSPACIYMARL